MTDENKNHSPIQWGGLETDVPPSFYADMDETEQSTNDNATLAERSPNDDGTMTGRLMNVVGTWVKRSMNDTRDFLLRLAQTQKATEKRTLALQLAAQTPKAILYPNVAEWLSNSQNIKEATSGRYQDIDELTDNPPQDICDRLNEIGLAPKDKTKWTPQNLMPVAFSVKYENQKSRYETQIWKLRKIILWAGLSIVALVFALLIALGILGPQTPPPQSIITDDEPLNIDTIIKRYQDQYHYQFGGWRIGQIKDTGHITKDNCLEYLHKQRELQDKSIQEQKKRKK